jgi:hypothetical protein
MSSDWWAKKLQGQGPAVGRPDPTPPMPPSQQPMTRYVAPTVQPPTPSKAQSVNQTQQCPECNSNNYLAVNANVAPRCYDCGYPISQSGSRYGSLTGAQVEGTTKMAAGNELGNNWNPQGIIGRVD